MSTETQIPEPPAPERDPTGEPFTAPGLDEKAEAMTDSQTPHSDIRILIVDDDATVRNLMHEFMQTVGYRSSTAASGEEALAELSRRSMDVVITDIMMPGMDGLQLTEMIRRGHDTEIIVMTGYSGDYSYEEVINKGASDFVFKPVRFEELLLRLKRVLKERDLRQELERRRLELEQLAITDDLTRLFNARYFYHQVRAEAERSVRYHHPLSLLLLDIDHFKDYNDTYGHLEGNHVLTRLGKVITFCLRTMDSAYRYGGEEFTVLLPETSQKEAFTVAERIRCTIAEETFTPRSGETVGVTISIGLTEYRWREKEPIEGFVRRADQALYLSKDKGRNTTTLA